jgi:hypothetical protein
MENFTLIVALACLKKLNNLEPTDLSDVITQINAQTTLLTNQLDTIESILDNQTPTGLSFNLLSLNPAYEVYSSHGWNTAPQNLQALYDADTSSASNLFGIPWDVAWCYGEIVMLPGISIPNITRINFKVGIRNSNNNISLFELAAFNVSSFSYINIWSYFGSASASQDSIVNIDIIVPFAWDKLKFKMTHAYAFAPQARFYDLKVWSVS